VLPFRIIRIHKFSLAYPTRLLNFNTDIVILRTVFMVVFAQEPL